MMSGERLVGRLWNKAWASRHTSRAAVLLGPGAIGLTQLVSTDQRAVQTVQAKAV